MEWFYDPSLLYPLAFTLLLLTTFLVYMLMMGFGFEGVVKVI